jgi:hypothetical protein
MPNLEIRSLQGIVAGCTSFEKFISFWPLIQVVPSFDDLKVPPKILAIHCGK